MKDLYTLLDAYSRSEEYPFHMPGHKRRIELLDHPYRIDLTEIHGFDNLHHPSGVLKEAQERAARFFGAEETYFLINGSTCGILAAIGACLYPGEKLLMGRNSHKSAYFAASLAGARTEYLYPGLDPGRGISGSVSPEQVRKALREESRNLKMQYARRAEREVALSQLSEKQLQGFRTEDRYPSDVICFEVGRHSCVCPG